MPRYSITAPDGRQVVIEGDSAPTDSEAEGIFANLPTKAAEEPKSPGIVRRVLNVLTAGVPNTGDMREYLRTHPEAALSANTELGMGGLTMPEAEAAAQKTAATGVRVASPLAGFALGGPFGGAVGGSTGELVAQNIEGGPIRPGAVLASGIASGIPGGALTTTGRAGRVLYEGAKQGVGGLVAKNVETLVDEGRVATPREALVSTAIPAAGGGIAQRIQAANPEIQAAVANAKTTDSTLRKTLQEGRDLGYVIPPSMVNPGALTNTLESIGGKAAMKQAAALKNQRVTNAAVREELGLAKDADITEAALESIRSDAAKPYHEISKMAGAAKSELDDLEKATSGISQMETEVARAAPTVASKLRDLKVQAGADVDALKDARFAANSNYRFYERSADPAALERAKAASELVETLEDRIEQAATQFGAPELVGQLKEARTRIAKTYDVERGLNLGNSNVDVSELGKALDRRKVLTGDLGTMARFQRAFPQAVVEGSKVPAPGVSALQAGSAAMFGLGGLQVSPVLGAMGVLAPFARAPARSLVLSEPYQRFATRLPLSIDAAPDSTAAIARLLAQQAAEQQPDDKRKP